MYLFRRLKKLTLLLFIGLFLFGCGKQEQENWNLKLESEIPFREISDEILRTAIISYISDSVIAAYGYDQLYFINLNSLYAEPVGRKGKGPGEYLSPYSFIKVGDKIFYTDPSKGTLTILGSQYEFIREIKFDFRPNFAFKFSDSEIGILHNIFNFDEKLINIYSLDGTLVRQIVNPPRNLYGYKDINHINYFYWIPSCFRKDNYIYIFLGMIPVVHKYNLATGESEFINYMSQLPAKPAKPTLTKELIAGHFQPLFVYEDKDYLIFNMWIRRSQSTKRMEQNEQNELVKFYFADDRFVPINIVNEDLGFDSYDALAIYENKLYRFDNENEVLLIYGIEEEK